MCDMPASESLAAEGSEWRLCCFGKCGTRVRRRATRFVLASRPEIVLHRVEGISNHRRIPRQTGQRARPLCVGFANSEVKRMPRHRPDPGPTWRGWGISAFSPNGNCKMQNIGVVSGWTEGSSRHAEETMQESPEAASPWRGSSRLGWGGPQTESGKAPWCLCLLDGRDKEHNPSGKPWKAAWNGSCPTVGILSANDQGSVEMLRLPLAGRGASSCKTCDGG